MFNLLPDDFKEKIKTEYKYRRFIVWLVFIILIQVSFLVFLMPSWIFSYYKEQLLANNLDRINNGESSLNISSTTSVILGTNTKIKAIDSVLQSPKVVPFLKTIISNKTSGILLNGFLYTLSDKEGGKISVSGLSSTREVLVSFVSSLEDSGFFKVVDLPVSNLAKDKNISFTINLTLATSP